MRDFLILYIRVLQHHGLVRDNIDAATAVPATLQMKTISREVFAKYSDMFHTKLWETVDANANPELATCMEG